MLARPAYAVCSILFGLTCAASTTAQAEPVDDKAVEILRRHGLDESRVMDHLSWICDVHGPRLTGSPNLARAQQWALDRLGSWGLSNPHLESWGPFGKGWRLNRFDMHVIGDNPWPVHAWPKAWSPSLPGRVTGEVVSLLNRTAEEVEAMDLSDKIVLMEGPRDVEEDFDGTAKRHDAESLLTLATGARPARQPGRAGRPIRTADFRAGFQRRQAVMNLVYQKRPLALLDRSYKGQYGTIFVSSATVKAPPGTPRDQRPRPWDTKGHAVIPQFTLAVEHYNRISRLLDKGVPVQLAVELDSQFFDDDPMQYNVLAEIAGTDARLGEEVVMLGAHFDSWHSGTGSTDNGVGSAVMMEAIRLITELVKETGVSPRRTIRLALWSGEEQGLYGSRAYVRQHFGQRGARGAAPTGLTAEHAQLSGYFNLDNGTGRIRGVYLQGNEAVRPIFRAWLKPFHDLEAATLTLSNTGGTDHLAFDGVGLPGFQFIQDSIAYGTRTHHSNMDNWDHAVADDLKQAATITASFVWHAAQRDELLPRKPRPQAAGGGR